MFAQFLAQLTSEIDIKINDGQTLSLFFEYGPGLRAEAVFHIYRKPSVVPLNGHWHWPLTSNMPDVLASSVIALGFDLFSLKMYWVACSTLWIYDYFLTLDDEIQCAWKGKKTHVFWLFMLNRYFAPVAIIITQISYFADTFTPERCNRGGFMAAIGTMLLNGTAQAFLTLRVYAITNRSLIFPCLSGLMAVCQSVIMLYALSLSFPVANETALLLSPDLSSLVTLPDTDPYHVCLLIVKNTEVPYLEASICLSLAFDGMAFLIILSVTFNLFSHEVMSIMKVIRRDGIMYFFALFSSNLVWLVLLLHGRPALKYMNNQPAKIISAIMINRITLNLKKASRNRADMGWGFATFERISELEFNPEWNMSEDW